MASRVYLGVDAPVDVAVGAVIGVVVPLLAFRFIVPSEVFPVAYRRGRSAHLDVGGRRGEAIRQALADQLGLTVLEVKPFGLSGSAGSTPLRIKVQSEQGATYLFAKLYARSHLRSDRWYKLGRALLYGRLEDEKPFNTVRRFVQQEDYMLRKLRLAGLPTPEPYGVVEITPEREYLIAFEFVEGAKELGEAEVDDAIIEQGLDVVRKLWEAGLAHRDVKPANLLVRDGKLYLIDLFFIEVRPTPWRQAVDLANMMLCLALRSSPERVYERALQRFSVAEISEAFAATRGLTMPTQLRHLMRAQGRNLHTEFCALLPERPQSISIQRWSVRRIGTALLAVLVLWLLAQQAWNLLLSDERLNVGQILARDLRCAPHEPLLLMAQSVPTASQVPCVKAMPAGWTLGEVVVVDRLARFTLDSKRAGVGAITVELRDSCDPGRLAQEQPDAGLPGIRVYQRVERRGTRLAATSWYVFPGGCITRNLTSGSETSQGQLLNDASTALGFTSRDALREAVRQEYGGRLSLDPAT